MHSLLQNPRIASKYYSRYKLGLDRRSPAGGAAQQQSSTASITQDNGRPIAAEIDTQTIQITQPIMVSPVSAQSTQESLASTPSRSGFTSSMPLKTPTASLYSSTSTFQTLHIATTTVVQAVVPESSHSQIVAISLPAITRAAKLEASVSETIGMVEESSDAAIVTAIGTEAVPVPSTIAARASSSSSLDMDRPSLPPESRMPSATSLSLSSTFSFSYTPTETTIIDVTTSTVFLDPTASHAYTFNSDTPTSTAEVVGVTASVTSSSPASVSTSSQAAAASPSAHRSSSVAVAVAVPISIAAIFFIFLAATMYCLRKKRHGHHRLRRHKHHHRKESKPDQDDNSIDGNGTPQRPSSRWLRIIPSAISDATSSMLGRTPSHSRNSTLQQRQDMQQAYPGFQESNDSYYRSTPVSTEVRTVSRITELPEAEEAAAGVGGSRDHNSGLHDQPIRQQSSQPAPTRGPEMVETGGQYSSSTNSTNTSRGPPTLVWPPPPLFATSQSSRSPLHPRQLGARGRGKGRMDTGPAGPTTTAWVPNPNARPMGPLGTSTMSATTPLKPTQPQSQLQQSSMYLDGLVFNDAKNTSSTFLRVPVPHLRPSSQTPRTPRSPQTPNTIISTSASSFAGTPGLHHPPAARQSWLRKSMASARTVATAYSHAQSHARGSSRYSHSIYSYRDRQEDHNRRSDPFDLEYA